MALTTTTIGSYPKPAYVAIPDMFQDRVETMKNPTRSYAEAVRALGADAEAVFARGTREAVLDQVGAGVDIPTDGEIRRENYIHYHCRHIAGIDFGELTLTRVRDGAYADALFPTITGPVGAGAPFLAHDWKVAQSFTERPVKITGPGPMTIGETIADAHYGDSRRRDAALAEAV
ncbi:MAG: 5-methyltetrahydropteroyltriglutamate--homocysteine methyltransferase, partial [Alphaproteobacteria bacterium]